MNTCPFKRAGVRSVSYQHAFRCSTQSWNEMTLCINLLFVVCCLLLVRFRTSSIFDAAVDPIQLKNVTFEHVKGVRSKVKCMQVLVLTNYYESDA